MADLTAVLQDLCSRFIINLPAEEYESFERLFFQIEEAWWFYEDHHRAKHMQLPALTLRGFAERLFPVCPTLRPFAKRIDEIFSKFNDYKFSVPTYGAIMLNPDMTKVVMVRSYTGNKWGFPKGKINKDESEEDCAVREVLEETGVDLAGRIVSEDVLQRNFRAQRQRMFVVPDVAENTVFETRTRKEIGAIEWVLLSSLPKNRTDPGANKYFMALPFIPLLKTWISKRRKASRRAASSSVGGTVIPVADLFRAAAAAEAQLQEPPQHQPLDPLLSFRFDQAAIRAAMRSSVMHAQR